MKPPTAKTRGDYCQLKCSHLKEYLHPFYHHCAWCDYQMKALFWYDGGWFADCKVNAPDEKLISFRKE